MPTVWQSLIPETPSTEPIALPPENGDLNLINHHKTTNHLSPNTNNHSEHHHPHHHSYSHHLQNNNTGGGGGNSGSGSGSSSGSGNNTNINNNNNNNNNKGRVLNRISSSVNCGEQLWRFYKERKERRKKKEKRKRVFLKSGEYNTKQLNVFEKSHRYLGDIFTTLVDIRWRWTLFVFSFSYALSWILFAIAWWIIISFHGDLKHIDDPNWKPCVVGVKGFASVFLFSVETQHTIGYGYHHMTSECSEAILILCLQSIAGVLIEAFLVGVVFAKLSRPKKRSQTLVFSRNAVICQRDNQMYLMFRVGDLRSRSHILEAHVRSQVITKKITAEGEMIPIHQEEIKVGGYGEDEDRILLFWPTLIVHPIDSESPFYTMSASDLLKAKLEVLVVMEGVVESTGMTTQVRTSFLPSEILWGHRFHSLTSIKSDTGQHCFDFDLFHATFPTDTPLCSSRDLDHIRHLKSEGLSGPEILSCLSGNGSETANASLHGETIIENNDKKFNNLELRIVNTMGEERKAPLELCDDDDDDDDDENDEHDESDSELDSHEDNCVKLNLNLDVSNPHSLNSSKVSGRRLGSHSSSDSITSESNV